MYSFSEEDIKLAYDKLEPYLGELEADRLKRDKYFQDLMEKGYDEIAQLLKCHLVVEHYLDIFLKQELGLSNLNDAKLTFGQKVKLLPDNQAVTFVKPGIVKLNQLRNKVAHQLDISFTKSDLGNISKILKIAREDTESLNFIDSINRFTEIACTWLAPTDERIQKYIGESISHIINK